MKGDFPKQLYVHYVDEGAGYFSADDTPDSVEDGERVAIYERREILRKRVTSVLEPLRVRKNVRKK